MVISVLVKEGIENQTQSDRWIYEVSDGDLWDGHARTHMYIKSLAHANHECTHAYTHIDRQTGLAKRGQIV